MDDVYEDAKHVQQDLQSFQLFLQGNLIDARRHRK